MQADTTSQFGLIKAVDRIRHENQTSRENQMDPYQITVGDLTYFKSQQWSLTNNAILLFAAIVGASQPLRDISEVGRIKRTAMRRIDFGSRFRRIMPSANAPYWISAST